MITRWQAARGYPKTGFLNKLQHKALQSEIVATRVASADVSDGEPVRRSRRGGGGGRHYQGGGGGGPGGLFDGMMGGLFRRWRKFKARTYRNEGGHGPPFFPR